MQNIICRADNLFKVPSTIGIYIFYNPKEIIYIGKSINIRARLKSHFENAKNDPKEYSIIKASTNIRILPTDSEFKALILESAFIKKNKPRYNRIWRDDKSYLYIKITFSDKYPKIFPVRRENDGKSLYFGPFSSLRLIDYLLKNMRRIMPFCSQNKISKTPCFYSKINLCKPCPNQIEHLESQKDKKKLTQIYKKNIKQIIKILRGKTDLLLNDFYNKIADLNKEQKYEEALSTRDRMLLLERLITDRLKVDIDSLNNYSAGDANQALLKIIQKYFPQVDHINRIECYDISNLGGQMPTASMVVVTKGIVNKKEYRRFKIRTQKEIINSDLTMLDHVIKRRFRNPWERPDIIVVDGGKPQVRAILKSLSQINVNIPLIGIAKNPDRLIIGINNLPVVRINFNNPGFNLIRLIRDESHRFAKKYHLLLRRKKMI